MRGCTNAPKGADPTDKGIQESVESKARDETIGKWNSRILQGVRSEGPKT